MSSRERFRNALFALSLVTVVYVALFCGRPPYSTEEPPADAKRLALDFARLVISEDWTGAAQLVSLDAPRFSAGSPADELRSVFDSVVEIDPHLSGPPRWVEDAALSDDSIWISFEGPEIDGFVEKGFIHVKVVHEVLSWRIYSYGFSFTQRTLD